MPPISLKTVSRMVKKFSQLHKAHPQETSAPRNHVEPMEITSPDGYKYKTILDPENARYLDKQGHYKLLRRNRFNKMPDIESPSSSPGQTLPCEDGETPLKLKVVCSKKDGKSERQGGEGEGEGEKAVMLRRRLELVESNKENISLHIDHNANLQPQPVIQPLWQPAGWLMRPNHGAVLEHFLQRSFSQKSIQSEHKNTDASAMQMSTLDGEVSGGEHQHGGGHVAVETLGMSSAALDVMDEHHSDQSKDYLSGTTVGKEGRVAPCLRCTSPEGEGSGSWNNDFDTNDICHMEDDSDTPQRAGGDNSDESETATERGGSSRTQLLHRRSKWHRSTNFTIQVEPEELVAGERLHPLSGSVVEQEGLVEQEGVVEQGSVVEQEVVVEQEGVRRVPPLHGDNSQQPSFEMEVRCHFSPQ